ncbi:type 1 glutamine amidotransferase [Myxosarcina sp. GI1]|uniref:type 1 glutamine amidotransferase n=1 Tax=Myxosarcina sp. GI1 TaxID=1541065 RepID=UPI000562D6AB|nr:type 1 glutamine amidotransferase [Myxosarcina sp. GI1]
MNLLIIQNSQLASLGYLGKCIVERNVNIEIVTLFSNDVLPTNINSYDGLIILGGAMNAEDDESYPYLEEIVRLIHLFAVKHLPILGICLGAQLIARAFGKRVYQHQEEELGFTPLYPLSEVTKTDPLLKNCLEPIRIMEWHFDTFDLPDEAKLLLTGDKCHNQAYRISDNIYGFQCHFEVDEAIILSWIDENRQHIWQHRPDFPQQLQQDIEKYLARSHSFCQNVCDGWLDLVMLEMNRKTYSS